MFLRSGKHTTTQFVKLSICKIINLQKCEIAQLRCLAFIPVGAIQTTALQSPDDSSIKIASTKGHTVRYFMGSGASTEAGFNRTKITCDFDANSPATKTIKLVANSKTLYSATIDSAVKMVRMFKT